MPHPSEIEGLPQLLSARARTVARGEDYVSVAQNALERGFDTPSILRLAIEEPPFFTPDLDRVFVSMLEECGIRQPTADDSLIAHAQIVAAEIVAGTLHPLDGLRAISEIFTLDYTPAGFGYWTTISEGLDCDYCRDSATKGHSSFEEAIRAEAETLLRARA